MAQTKKRKSQTTRNRKRTSKKKQNDTPMRFTLVIVMAIVIMLGVFQLGLVGIAIDSFFNYLFGLTRYLTYFLLLIALGFIAYNGKLPKTRRLTGSIVLQIALLFVAQLYFMATGGMRAKREPVLSYVFQSYDAAEHMQFGGGLFGFYLMHVVLPLISLAGVVLLTLVLLVSSGILLLKKRHRDVAKVWLEQFKQSTASSYEKVKAHQSERRLTRKEKKEQKRLEREQQRAAEPKDVSDFPEVDIPEEEPTDYPSIPIFGHHSVEVDAPSQPVQNEMTPPTQPDIPKRHKAETETHSEVERSGSEGSITEAGAAENLQYEIPPLSLLKEPKRQQTTSKTEVQRKGKLLETTLKNFGVDAKVTQIKIGPAVTQYEVQPAQGVKVSRIVNLHNDIALALAAKDIRIEAPIPGKSAVGIEVPNQKVAIVTLKEVLDEKFPAKNKLEVALGRDISGEPITAELNKMPHLLVAGSTGSGKSVCINGIITSILLNAKPHEVKLMMIDPKMVELNVYNGIPHLLTPVVTNPHKAAQALEKVVAEMERRYDLFQHSGTRNIEGYNDFITRKNKELEEKEALLPYIVVIVDELADLMMVAGKDVETAITRITQMARAAGIHLIIATQRPSVDVITGLIKNNIPSRIAFAVSSQTDSRTIIDSGGAEKLLGKGDMLFIKNGGSTRTRVQGAFLSDQEVQTIVDYVVAQQKANYVKEMEPDAVTEGSTASESDDPLYKEAYLFVLEQQKASTSLLQRQFRIGYNRASRIMDDLERNQVIGPQKGSKPRQILVDLNGGEV
ncbi:DNA translocase FtsK [Staphylococcus pseudintermedius]|uniref:DNA translocase FtsK n=1 Tax=Staphylococcus pseudintermedius TaxID=283734 RepID=UPI000CFD90DD|nr:DNA translocase FtsK [Staphylococcus pseudintermedius]EGQ0378520.1 DNA translocase FtsK [Staphylococcus pseudintermedius]EGQ0388248.1 DNA translocase FtsK [Staphylococcus pseudintermedius]EGQ1300502.1 cell division protein FtsK [Staphylococcus pseudintermedius]EGQ1634562.1 DNA translocase FtsK [Staphylococcus pseudintermedius]EGQ1638728.1 DNA translocase FtsK [Staphylococcus pseudintermedius]